MNGYLYDNGALFVEPYQDYFYAYNPILAKEREAELRRRLGEANENGEDLHLFGGEEAGCCRRRRAWCIGGVLVVCTIGIVLLILHYGVHGI
jgi:hypothetical protein